jgi:beta-aspartyl-peptidase (threonine type)
MENKFSLVIHGGAGVGPKSLMTPEMEKDHHEALSAALRRGYDILEKGGKALDAVTETVKCLEDCPLYNAGRGSVFSSEGRIEMDASIMEGSSLQAGAVSTVTNIRNPIEAARLVMERTPHVLLIGKGAEKFAEENGCKIEEPSYFHTDLRWKQFESVRNTTNMVLDDVPVEGKKKGLGTVGAAACDKYGDVAAATSTGGMTNKMVGRVGDSPIIGAGTYANNKTCAISSTGMGEYFIRTVGAYDVSALMEYAGKPLQEAAKEYVHARLKNLGGQGGVIGVDAKGNITLEFNTEGMYRGSVTEKGDFNTAIY